MTPSTANYLKAAARGTHHTHSLRAPHPLTHHSPFPVPRPSLHFALQLHFILVGAMEDYQLEGSDGRRTAYGNPRYYRRCAKLLQNVHRCVVYGAPRVRHVSRRAMSGLVWVEIETQRTD